MIFESRKKAIFRTCIGFIIASLQVGIACESVGCKEERRISFVPGGCAISDRKQKKKSVQKKTVNIIPGIGETVAFGIVFDKFMDEL